jgi:large subunit ribosomal protein L7/L12
MATNTFDKMIEDIRSMSVMELADFVKAVEEAFGVSAAAMAVAAPAASAAPAAAEEKAEYSIKLVDAGANKIQVIKALRAAVPSLNLSDAKKAVEEAPTVVVETSPKDDANKIKKALEEAGAKVELA